MVNDVNVILILQKSKQKRKVLVAMWKGNPSMMLVGMGTSAATMAMMEEVFLRILRTVVYYMTQLTAPRGPKAASHGAA